MDSDDTITFDLLRTLVQASKDYNTDYVRAQIVVEFEDGRTERMCNTHSYSHIVEKKY